MRTTRTRQQVIAECANMVAACWNHYVDEPISAGTVENIQSKLMDLIPGELSTARWSEYATQKEKEYAADPT